MNGKWAMKRVIGALALLLISAELPNAAFFIGATYAPPNGGGGNVPFTALHTYYLAPTTASPAGNDSNNGTSPSTPWATTNHAVMCGDVIVAASGTYGATLAAKTFGAVSNCPSTSGGIDGIGGVYFAILVCGGSSVGSCILNPGSTGTNGFTVRSSYWAIEGWEVTNANTAFQSWGQSAGNTYHHIAFINNATIGVLQGYDIADCSSTSSACGVDYWAVVGNIAQNSNSSSAYEAAIDAVAPYNYDAAAGTHIYVYNNYLMNNLCPACITGSDGEAIMFDTWDEHLYSGTGVIANNIGYYSTRYGTQVFQQSNGSPTPTVKIYNNTFYYSNVDSPGNEGEINMQATGTWTFIAAVYDNIANTGVANNGASGGNNNYAYLTGPYSTITVGGSGLQNIFWSAGQNTCASSPGCLPASPPYAAISFGATSYLGTNTYESAAFQNTADLISNQLGAPNCSGFGNTTACVGWNAATGTLTTPSIISDLIGTAIGTTPYYSTTAGKGYQLPSTTCTANADYPTWLKGIVYLQWNGTSLTENADLVTKPCGL